MCRHVHRRGPQPRVPARHPVARKLPRARQGQESHAGQSSAGGRASALGGLAGTSSGAAPSSPPPPWAAATLEIVRSWPHGHVAAVLGACAGGQLELADRAPTASTARALVVAMLVQRLLAPGSKLATALGSAEATRTSTLSPGVAAAGPGRGRSLCRLGLAAGAPRAHRDGAGAPPPAGGQAGARRRDLHGLPRPALPVAKWGYSRDGKRDNPQIVFGVLSNPPGCPVAVEVFEGNTADPKTVAAVLTKPRQRFDLERLILVGDRGILTAERIGEDLAGAQGLEWITAFRVPAIQAPVPGGALQLSLFDEQDLAEIPHPDYPGERLIVCNNPLLAADRAGKRGELLAATENDLAAIATATKRANGRCAARRR